MKKVRITESQLRGLVKKMIKENVETSSIPTIIKYYNQSDNNTLKQKISNYGNSRLPENPNHKQLYDFLNKIGDKNKLEIIKKMLERDIQKKSITESQLRGIVKRMIKEEMSEEILTEGNWSKIMKGVRNGEAPFSIIAFENNWPKPKILGQEIGIQIIDAIPAYYEEMKRKYPKASKISIEDGGGQVVYVEKLY